MADDKSKRRIQSQTERDAEGLKARLERDARDGRPIEFDAEEVTGKLLGEELAETRSRRPTPERLNRLEVKHDQLAADVGEIKESVAKIDGKLEVVPQLVDLLKQVVAGEVAGDNAKLTATLEINKAKAADEIEEAKDRRARWAKTWTQVLAGAGLAGTAILAAIQARGC